MGQTLSLFLAKEMLHSENDSHCIMRPVLDELLFCLSSRSLHHLMSQLTDGVDCQLIIKLFPLSVRYIT